MDFVLHLPKSLSHNAFPSISMDGIPDAPTGGNSKPTSLGLPGQHENNEMPRIDASAAILNVQVSSASAYSDFRWITEHRPLLFTEHLL